MALIDSAVYLGGRRAEGGRDPARIVTEARAQGGMAWISLSRTDADELQTLADVLGLHPLAVRDCLKGHQRSKLERYDDMTFVVLQPARYFDDRETVECSEVDLFVGPDYVVTVDSDDQIDDEVVRRNLDAHPQILAKGPYAVLWGMVEHVLTGYGPVLSGLENDIDEIEDQLFSNDENVSRRIFKLQREVIDLQHATAPLPDMLERVQDIVAGSTKPGAAPAFHDVEDTARHLMDRVDAFKHTLESALGVHATLVEQANSEAMRRMTEFSITQNDQVKKVSSWAAILFAPTLVGTIYGMNFQYMPELSWPWGYPMALTLMVATSVTLYFLFKRRGWL
ncbi:magnesium and cobalt transport protein CorA [Microbacterium sp. 4R-513]|uniref:magnesium and cobalt transport protein CorA n=1 Tax=Microbacterium sp. 4R-513 TaxID=2567934 RepID=UPI0013E1AF90|nr:magnesium and cobalt transport protein CorA [Microbacterium sp. 4R-513]QIG40192.1 magnesium and cobalt transport protein CorA [Microbacterium sp. 4R-513]